MPIYGHRGLCLFLQRLFVGPVLFCRGCLWGWARAGATAAAAAQWNIARFCFSFCCWLFPGLCLFFQRLSCAFFTRLLFFHQHPWVPLLQRLAVPEAASQQALPCMWPLVCLAALSWQVHLFQRIPWLLLMPLLQRLPCLLLLSLFQKAQTLFLLLLLPPFSGTALASAAFSFSECACAGLAFCCLFCRGFHFSFCCLFCRGFQFLFFFCLFLQRLPILQAEFLPLLQRLLFLA